MTAALQVVTAYGFDTLALTRIEALVKASNPASVRVLEKIGYRHEGHLPHDLLLYAILREPPPAP